MFFRLFLDDMSGWTELTGYRLETKSTKYYGLPCWSLPVLPSRLRLTPTLITTFHSRARSSFNSFNRFYPFPPPIQRTYLLLPSFWTLIHHSYSPSYHHLSSHSLLFSRNSTLNLRNMYYSVVSRSVMKQTTAAAAQASRMAATSTQTRSYTSTMHDNDPKVLRGFFPFLLPIHETKCLQTWHLLLWKVLEREKARSLRKEQHLSPIHNAPGWNESLASASEANVKVRLIPFLILSSSKKVLRGLLFS